MLQSRPHLILLFGIIYELYKCVVTAFGTGFFGNMIFTYFDHDFDYYVTISFGVYLLFHHYYENNEKMTTMVFTKTCIGIISYLIGVLTFDFVSSLFMIFF